MARLLLLAALACALMGHIAADEKAGVTLEIRGENPVVMVGNKEHFTDYGAYAACHAPRRPSRHCSPHNNPPCCSHRSCLPQRCRLQGRRGQQHLARSHLRRAHCRCPHAGSVHRDVRVPRRHRRPHHYRQRRLVTAHCCSPICCGASNSCNAWRTPLCPWYAPQVLG